MICVKQKQDIYCILGIENYKTNLFRRYIIETLELENGYGSFLTHVERALKLLG